MNWPFARNIHSYRSISGRPRRRIAFPHPSYASLITEIRRRTEKLAKRSGESLAEATADLKRQVMASPCLTRQEIVVQAFALVTEAVRRTSGMRFFDVQLNGGLVLAAGAIAEIATGEGKTVITALPAYLQALSGSGVHIATTNDYLSARDYEQLRPAFNLLGVSVGLLKPQISPKHKSEAYGCDITYGPGYEFGFDFLRDQLTLRGRQDEPLGVQHLRRLQGQVFPQDQLVQRGRQFAIIDEADSVLIDEASTPLILSGTRAAVDADPAAYYYARDLVDRMEEERDFVIDRTQRCVALTPAGWEAIHEALGQQTACRLARPWSKYVDNALRAKHLLRGDVDFVVCEAAVMLVDQNTGRIHGERTWRGGLHQAVEVAQGLEPGPEKPTQARITRQRYGRLYSTLSGMTGTTVGAEDELREFYDLAVVRIPTHRPCRRVVLPSRFFVSTSAKYAAIAHEVIQRQQRGQPVLIGTASIQSSRAVAAELSRIGVSHVLLNGMQNASEASVIARAGKAGSVVVATNMAGRGTNIRPDTAAVSAGGLHVIAAQFHACQRVDRQLIGRSARQGDPGSCQFFASAEDELLVQHGESLSKTIRSQADPQGECHVDLTERVRRLQSQLERRGLASRRQMVAHDQWIESVQSALARRA